MCIRGAGWKIVCLEMHQTPTRPRDRSRPDEFWYVPTVTPIDHPRNRGVCIRSTISPRLQRVGSSNNPRRTNGETMRAAAPRQFGTRNCDLPDVDIRKIKVRGDVARPIQNDPETTTKDRSHREEYQKEKCFVHSSKRKCPRPDADGAGAHGEGLTL